MFPDQVSVLNIWERTKLCGQVIRIHLPSTSGNRQTRSSIKVTEDRIVKNERRGAPYPIHVSPTRVMRVSNHTLSNVRLPLKLPRRKRGSAAISHLLETKTTTTTCTIVFILLLGTVETDSPDQIQPWFSQPYSGGQPRMSMFLAE